MKIFKNNYIYAYNFDQNGYFCKRRVIIKVDSKKNLPLESTYKYRTFKSRYSLNKLGKLLNHFSLEELKATGKIKCLSNFNYIGREARKEKILTFREELEMIEDEERIEKLIRAYKIIDSMLKDLDPIIIKSKDEVEEIYDSSIRDDSKKLELVPHVYIKNIEK